MTRAEVEESVTHISPLLKFENVYKEVGSNAILTPNDLQELFVKKYLPVEDLFEKDEECYFYTRRWTSNPGYILHDLLTNKRYGGKIDLDEISNLSLCETVVFCDESVPKVPSDFFKWINYEQTGSSNPIEDYENNEELLNAYAKSRIELDFYRDLSGRPTAGQNDEKYIEYARNQTTQKRATCNVVFNRPYLLLQAANLVASSFYGSIKRINGMVTFVPPPLGDKVLYAPLVTRANVVDGEFIFQRTNDNDYINHVDVTWLDPDDNFRPKVEVVRFVPYDTPTTTQSLTGKGLPQKTPTREVFGGFEEDYTGTVDEDSWKEAWEHEINNFGVRPRQVVAAGAITRGQAIRYGRHLLLTSRLQNTLVSYRASLDQMTLTPGDVVRISEPIRNTDGVRLGGRCNVVDSKNPSNVVIKLDDLIETDEAGETLYVMNAAGRGISGKIKSFSQETVICDFSDIAETETLEFVENCIYTIAPKTSEDFEELYQIISIQELEPFQSAFTAVKYLPNKFDMIEGTWKQEL